MKRLVAFVFCLLLLLSVLSCSSDESVRDGIRLYFLDVGQGDCILIRTVEGDILIDAGTEQAQELLCFRLRELGVRELSLAIFTHADEDHIGGADGVLKSFPVKEIWLGGQDEEHDSINALRAVVEENNIPIGTVSAGSTRQIGGVILTALYPMAGVISEDSNQNSIVVKLHYGKVSAIFTGDADAEVERDLVARYGHEQLAADLYKVGHHGSYTSTTQEFLDAVRPRYAVISAGRGNSYGHPHGEVLDRLEASGAEILRIDLLGEIAFESDGSTWKRR